LQQKHLFYISQNYSFEILRPLQRVIRQRGDQCAWFVEGEEVNLNNFNDDETQLGTIEQAIEYSPDAVFVPGNVVPNFISGLKVQVFHGLEWKKKGHFRIRGFFDLYCTHGAITTDRFNQLATEHGYFSVVETGWPKLDPLFQTPPYQLETKLPVILFAPTFSPDLSCALECLDEIKKLVKQNKHHWLVKFHPKMNQEWIKLYKAIIADNFDVVECDSCLPLLQRADILVSDTSSIIGEFMLLNKPAVTYKNSNPGDYLIDIQSPEKLAAAIESALHPSDTINEKIANESKLLHPYNDGLSSQRILESVDNLLANPSIIKKKKPLNMLRSFKLRKKLGYWKW